MGKPLVYASRPATRQAGRLLPGRVLENLVSAAILRGDCCVGVRGGFVFLDEMALVARVERKAGRLRRAPRQWLVTDLEVHRDYIEGGNSNGNGNG